VYFSGARMMSGPVGSKELGTERGLDVRICEDDSCSAGVFNGEFSLPVLASDATWKRGEESAKPSGKLFNYRWRGRDDPLAGF